MDEELYQTVSSLASAAGLNISDYDVVDLGNGTSMLNNGPVPDYSSIRGEYPNSASAEFRGADGSVVRQQMRPGKGKTGGQFGRNLGPKLRGDLQQVLVSCFLENYDRLVNNQTGALREAVGKSELVPDSNELIGYTFKLADLPGKPRSSRFNNDNGGARPSTAYYGPIVFLGRGAIITQKKMRFLYRGSIVSSHVSRATGPRNIFELSTDQIARISSVILKPISEELQKYMKEQLEGTNNRAD